MNKYSLKLLVVAVMFLFTLPTKVQAVEYYSANVGYQVSVNGNWSDYAYGGSLAGSEGKDVITSLELHLVDAPELAKIEYRVYTKSGWLPWVDNYDSAGNGDLVLGLQVRLADYPNATVYYQTYRKGLGWGSWVSNGKTSGKLDSNYPITGVRVQVEEIGVKYQSSISGDLKAIRHNGETLGSGSLETLRMGLSSNLEGVSLVYRAYFQNEGWSTWAKDWEIIGTSGSSKVIEAIQAKLEGTDKYYVSIQPYVKGSGWWGWVYNGGTAGVVGSNQPLEAYRIKIEKKVYVAPPVVDTVVVESAPVIGSNPNVVTLSLDAAAYSSYLTGETIDGVYDDPFGQSSSGYWMNYQVQIGWKVQGLTVVTFTGIGDRIQAPKTFGGCGDDAVNSNQFEVYLGTYVGGVFTVTANSTNQFSTTGATHTMILYDNEDPDTNLSGDPEYLSGLVMSGVYSERRINNTVIWQVDTSSSTTYNYLYWIGQ